MAYYCHNCGKQIKEVGKNVTCPVCGGKVFWVERPPVSKTISTD